MQAISLIMWETAENFLVLDLLCVRQRISFFQVVMKWKKTSEHFELLSVQKHWPVN